MSVPPSPFRVRCTACGEVYQGEHVCRLGQSAMSRRLSDFARAARRESLAHYKHEPREGELVVEITGMRRRADPDSIGYLVGAGLAPYNEDGTGESRSVWDVVPLSLARGKNGLPYQRWENAEFRLTLLPVPFGLRLRALRARRRYQKARCVDA